ncbi:MAG: hypothetical protein AABX98_01150 [Nanoarchaeota archaeon]
METANKQYDVKGWEYYLALAMIVIAGIATLLMALHVIGVM